MYRHSATISNLIPQVKYTNNCVLFRHVAYSMYNYMIFFFEKCFLKILYPWHRQYSPAQCYLHPSYNHTLPFFDNSCRAILFWITDDKFLSLRYKMSIFHRKLSGKGRNFIIFKDTVTSWCRSIFIYPITYIILLWCFNFQLQNMLEKVFSKEENLKSAC